VAVGVIVGVALGQGLAVTLGKRVASANRTAGVAVAGLCVGWGFASPAWSGGTAIEPATVKSESREMIRGERTLAIAIPSTYHPRQ
jgi:hypothetical protein